MSWQDEMRDDEREEIDRAKAVVDAARAVYKPIVRKIKSRCEQRARRRKEREGK